MDFKIPISELDDIYLGKEDDVLADKNDSFMTELAKSIDENVMHTIKRLFKKNNINSISEAKSKGYKLKFEQHFLEGMKTEYEIKLYKPIDAASFIVETDCNVEINSN